MKAVVCRAFGPPESLELAELELPKLGEKDVHVRVRAAGVNFPDLLMIQGKYQFKPPFPFAPGAECSGDVLAVGSAVTHVKKGDRVMAMTGHGAFAEEVVAPAHKIMPFPAEMDYVTAAAMGLTYGTSAFALMQRAQLQPNEWLLVHGASGGVGLSAVEIGKAMGARVIGTGGDDAKLRVATEHGCDHVINYAEGEFKDKVKELTGGKGADVIYDAVGGDAFDQSLRCINWNGRLLVIGFASGRIPSAPANLALLKNCSIVGVFWGAWTEREPAGNRKNFDLLFRWWKEGKVRPHVSHKFPLARTVEALNAVAARKVTGKAVIEVA
jgi:NADPH2:quinone reductase